METAVVDAAGLGLGAVGVGAGAGAARSGEQRAGEQGAAVVDRAAQLLAQVDGLLAELVELPVAMPTGPDAALGVLREVEAVARRVRAVQVAVADAVDRSGVWRADGHRHGHQLVARGCRLSGAEQRVRDRSMRALRELPCVAAGLRSGRVGAPQVERIARTWANPRVRSALVELDAVVVELAARQPFDVLDRMLANWEASVDEEGAAGRAAAAHRDRDASIDRDLDGAWVGSFRCGSLDGAQLHDVFDAFYRAELEADWAHARAHHGDAATVAHLGRTPAQRRFDALAAIFRSAADHRAGTGPGGGSVIETIVVIDEETFDRHLRRLTGQHPAPRALDLDGCARRGGPPDGPAPPGDGGDGWACLDPPTPLADVAASLDWRDEQRAQRPEPQRGRFRCETLDGAPIDPTEAVANAIVSHVRRAVVTAAGVTIDLGRRQRLFAGHAALAARLAATTCYWPACPVPTTRCQTDHLQDWHHGGPTDQANVGIACSHHNRLKNHGYSVRRGPDGTLHVHRPDGTRIDP